MRSTIGEPALKADAHFHFCTSTPVKSFSQTSNCFLNLNHSADIGNIASKLRQCEYHFRHIIDLKLITKIAVFLGLEYCRYNLSEWLRNLLKNNTKNI